MSANFELGREVVAEWNRCHGAFFQIREKDLPWLFEKQDWLEYRVEILGGVKAIIALATEPGRAAGVSARTLWLSLHGEIPTGGEEKFLTELVEMAKRCGKTRLTLGGEEFHFVPGIPAEGKLLEFARAQGFALHEAADFAGALRTEALSRYVSEAKSLGDEGGWCFTTAAGEEALAELGDFLLKEFPGRWEREFRFWRSRSDTSCAFWNVLRDREGKVQAFSRLALRGEKAGEWLPGALRLPLLAAAVDSPRDASLGPIGVAGSGRGRGTGKILLGLSLQFLLDRDAEQVCIDWTNAYNYYMPLGLLAVRKYCSAHKDF